jgi:hypothetical protein
VLKYSEIEEATEHEYVPSDEKAILIKSLREQGHKPIGIGRAIAVVEQCRPGDDFPEGFCDEPLKVTIYPDPTLDKSPVEVFMHAGRHGLMDILTRREGRTSAYIAVDFGQYRMSGNIMETTSVAAAIEKLIWRLEPGFRKRVYNAGLGTEIYPLQGDSLLEQYAAEARAVVRKYLDRAKEIASESGQDDTGDGLQQT